MQKRPVQTDQAPAPVGPYSQAIVAQGPFVFCSGQIPIDPATGEVNREDVASQTRLVLENLKAVLAEAASSLEHVVRTGVFLSDMNDFAAMNAVYTEFFDGNAAPSRVTVEVSRLPKDVLVEIEAIAMVASSR